MPSIFVHRIVKAKCEKRIERLKVRKSDESAKTELQSDKIREKIVRRVALEFKDGMHINLGEPTSKSL